MDRIWAAWNLESRLSRLQRLLSSLLPGQVRVVADSLDFCKTFVARAVVVLSVVDAHVPRLFSLHDRDESFRSAPAFLPIL